MSVRLVKWLGILLVFALLCGCGESGADNSSDVSTEASGNGLSTPSSVDSVSE